MAEQKTELEIECTECGTIFDSEIYDDCPCCELLKENEEE